MTARRLALVTERSRELELCGYCPKLCRAACPVSNVELDESLIPWGKMTSVWRVAQSTQPLDPATAATSWACTGCRACSQHCEHANPVAETLYDARAAYFEQDQAPSQVVASAGRHAQRVAEAGGRLSELHSEAGVRADAPTALLIGCEYLRHALPEARAIVRVAVALLGAVRLVPGCCGAPLLHAGDRRGFEASNGRLRATLAGAERVVVGDPGCALTLPGVPFVTLVALAAQNADLLARVDGLGAHEHVRYHDPCALGRGLGQYDEPRRVLSRALGRESEEFSDSRQRAECSGAGALLPVAMPEASARIAAQRLAAHEREGGGLVVTACAASLRRFRKQGARVSDLASVISASLAAKNRG